MCPFAFSTGDGEQLKYIEHGGNHLHKPSSKTTVIDLGKRAWYYLALAKRGWAEMHAWEL